MPDKSPPRVTLPLTSCVPVTVLQQLSLTLHRSSSLVCTTFLRFSCFNLMSDQATPQYLSDISHAAPSSSENSTCSVEPGSAEDVSKIVRYLVVTHQLPLTGVLLAKYLEIKPNPFCG